MVKLVSYHSAEDSVTSWLFISLLRTSLSPSPAFQGCQIPIRFWSIKENILILIAESISLSYFVLQSGHFHYLSFSIRSELWYPQK